MIDSEVFNIFQSPSGEFANQVATGPASHLLRDLSPRVLVMTTSIALTGYRKPLYNGCLVKFRFYENISCHC
jgi:hypothetical protein